MSIKRRLIACVILIILPITCLWIFQKKLITFHGQTMGTTYSIKMEVPLWVNQNKVKHALNEELKRLISIFSTWEKDSEISLFNANKTINPIAISPEMLEVMQTVYEVYDVSSGYYDPTLKPLLDLWGFTSTKSYFQEPKTSSIKQVDPYIGLDKLILEDQALTKQHENITLELSSIAKGYAVDILSNIVDRYSPTRYMVEVGGEIKLFAKPNKKPWKIGVRNPSYDISDQNVLVTLSLKNGAVATSGDYQHFFQKDDKIYSHIFDPKAKRPVINDVASVTIFAPNCLLADAFATAVMVLGVERGLSMVEALDGVECLILRRSNSHLEPYVSSRFQELVLDSKIRLN